MSWNINYSAQARQDLKNIYDYITYDLLASESAVRQSIRIMEAIRTLDEMPMRHQLYQDEPWKSKGVRYLLIDNYIVFYLPDKNKNTVSIIRIMYSGRDVGKQMNNSEL